MEDLTGNPSPQGQDLKSRQPEHAFDAIDCIEIRMVQGIGGERPLPSERSVAQIDRFDELLRDFECKYAARLQQIANRLQIIERPQEVLEDVMHDDHVDGSGKRQIVVQYIARQNRRPGFASGRFCGLGAKFYTYYRMSGLARDREKNPIPRTDIENSNRFVAKAVDDSRDAFSEILFFASSDDWVAKQLDVEGIVKILVIIKVPVPLEAWRWIKLGELVMAANSPFRRQRQ